MSETETETRLHRIDDAADRLGICRAQVYRLMKAGVLVGVKIGAGTRVTHESLERCIRNAPRVQLRGMSDAA
ncbi:MAG: helix-turn-helix domain-containing protein [Acetobacteraceae bacterium]